MQALCNRTAALDIPASCFAKTNCLYWGSYSNSKLLIPSRGVATSDID